jgi:D-inositol-3-phosphate glycosyltransferase
MPAVSDLNVLHIGAGRYVPEARDHVTYAIWRELAVGFRSYRVIGRSTGKAADWTDGNLRVTLLRSWLGRETEFLATQFLAVSKALRDPPDAIVSQSPVLGGLAAILIARLTGARVLLELHGAEFVSLARFGSKTWLLQRLTGFSLKRAHRIRVLCPRMARESERLYGAALAPRTRVLPPRVDLSRFPAKEWKARPDRTLRIAMVGAVNGNKGQLSLIKALEQAPFAVELHVVGGGPDLPAIRRRADAGAEGSSNLRVVAHGPLPHAAVADVLRSCDVFVMYSRTEAMPRAMMEAMAVGLPVITTDAGFCADVVEHGIEGFVLGAAPDREIVEALRQFAADASLAPRMGAAARERAGRDYDSVRLFDEYRQLIAETANS